MSATVPQDEEEAILRLERERLLDRESVEPEDLPTLLGPIRRRAVPKRVMVLFGILFVYLIGMMISAAAGVDIIYLAVCYHLSKDSSTCFKDPEASNLVAQFTSVVTVVRGVLGLVTNGYFGGLSDRVGRKPVLITSLAMGGFGHLLSWYIVFHSSLWTYWLLLLPTVLDCMGGSMPIVTMMITSYISDYIRDPGHRGRLLALLDGMVYLSVATGPVLGSWIMKMTNLETLYIIAFSMTFLAAFLAIIYIVESLSTYYRRRNSTIKRSFGNILSPLAFSHLEDPADRRNTRILLFCTMMGTEFGLSFIIVLLLYPKRMFGWSAVETGYLLSLMSSTRTIFLLVVFPYLYSRLGKRWHVSHSSLDRIDKSLIQLSFVLTSVGYFSMGKAGTSAKFYMGGVLDATSAIGMPSSKNALLKYVPHGEAGSFLAAVSFLNALVGVVLPSLFVKLLSWSFDWNHSLAFELMASIFGMLLVSTTLLKPRISPNN